MKFKRPLQWGVIGGMSEYTSESFKHEKTEKTLSLSLMYQLRNYKIPFF